MSEKNIYWEFYSAKKHFNSFSDQWDQLNASICSQHPLLNSRFIQPLIDSFGYDNLTLALLRAPDNIVAAILLQRKNSIVWSTFSPSQLPMTPMLLDRDMMSRALHLLVRKLPGFCVLLEILHHDPEFCPIKKDIVEQCCIIRRYGTTTRISCDFDFDTFWTDRPKKLRENIRRYLKKAKSAGELVFKEYTGHGEIETALKCYGDIESLGWKGDAGTAIHVENIQGQFYKQVLTGFSGDQNAHIYEISLNNEVIASRIAVKNHNAVVMLKTTYLENWRHLAPGKLLLYLTLEHLFNNFESIKTIDFYTNAKSEQLFWATETRDIQHINYYHNKFIKNIFVAADWILRRKVDG